MGLLTLALILDWLVGDPGWLWKRVPHPVVMLGRFIDRCDRWRSGSGAIDNGQDRRDLWLGIGLVGMLLAIAIAFAGLVELVSHFLPVLGLLTELIVVAVLLAQRSLYEHVARVASALREGGIEEGRRMVALVVGRDVSALSESGVCKAAIESLAENFSDGVVAPVFWYAIGGLPGLIFYKAINTADSMIGHRTPRHEFFGKPAALLDDLLNWMPARLSALLAGLAAMFLWSKNARSMMEVVRRDAPAHRSPNAGWPETAFAHALDVSLGGPRTYGGGEQVQGARLHAGGRDQASVYDIEKALVLMISANLILIGAIFGIWLVVR